MNSPLPGYASHFGLNNVPFGIASSERHLKPQCVTRYQDNVIFLADLHEHLQDIKDLPHDVFSKSTLNAFAALPKVIHRAVRQRLQNLFSTLPDKPNGDNNNQILDLPITAIEPISAVSMHIPVLSGDFSDFSCSSDHVQNASEAMTGTRSYPPAFYHQPIGYAGRCSSLEVSGMPQERPLGQFWSGKPGASEIVFGASRKMDFELELGCIVGAPVGRRDRVNAKEAGESVFGFVLVNDWSARDIQGFEMTPLGPMNGKNLGTSISPWVIVPEALKRFRTASLARKADVPVRPYLSDTGRDALEIKLSVQILSPGSKKRSTVCVSNSSYLYWTLEQCLAQQALAGCGLQTGDIIATGTVSGSGEEEHGCLMEHMRVGTTPPRGYLEDGETVLLEGFCGEGVGFGECIGTLLPAREVTGYCY